MTIILQLAIADFLLGASLCPELWSINTRSWPFGHQACIAYRGLNVFASTVSSYLVVTIALHSIATINIEEKSISKQIKRNENEEDDEIRSSRHSLVTSSDSSTPPRTMNLDYRLSSKKISVIQPTMFIWVLSISLSVPEFVLASTIDIDDGVVLCTLMDTSQRVHMYSILVLFNLLLPIVVISVAGVLVVLKLRKKQILSHIECFEPIAALKLSVWLILLYIALCAPRSIVNAYKIYSKTVDVNQSSLVQNYEIIETSLATSGTYIASTLVRPFLSIILFPRVRKSFSFASHVQADNV